jgi:thiamine kinase-like enzyme
MERRLDPLLASLQRVLACALPGYEAVSLMPLADTGLAHWHVRLGDTGMLARIPKQSQMQLGAAENLAYQRACFERAGASGHTPRLHHVIGPDGGLPRGALIVDYIDGRPVCLPNDLPLLMRALAAIHSLPLPSPAERAPLRDTADPLADLLVEVREQAQYLGTARIDRRVQDAIETELALFADRVASPGRPPKALIAFDAHPGNFLTTADARAVLVDLEKARYAYPPLDLAHATLYTSTTWDVTSSAVLSVDEISAAYHAWSQTCGTVAAAYGPWHLPLRRAMWLWAITWCAKWRAVSPLAAKAGAEGEDWSAANSDEALVAHVRERVDHYLSPDIVMRMRAEFAQLDTMFATQFPSTWSST